MRKQFLCCIFLLFTIFLSAQTDSSDRLCQKLTIQFTNATVQSALRQLTRLTGINFSYNTSIIPRGARVNESYNRAEIRQILQDILVDINLFYREKNGTVIILKKVYNERVLKGRVVDASNGSPLPFANVFIQNSTQGAASDQDGEFLIEDVPKTRFNLVASYVGYESRTVAFTADQTLEGRTFVLELDLDPVSLETINVMGRALRRKRFRNQRRLYKRFEAEFLGGSENAEKCKIVNPEVLKFEVLDSLDNYRVTADDILYVENYALGYRVSYLLEEFKFENGLKMVLGKARFSELETKSRKRYSKWGLEREKAYYGSENHFLNSLIEGTLTEEGFALNVVNYDSITSEYTTPLNPMPIEDILTLEEANQEDLYYLSASSDIEITYKKEFEDSDYKKLYRSTSKSGNYKYTDKKVRSSIALSDNASLSSYQVFGLDVTDVDLFQKSIIFFLNDRTLISYPGQFLQPQNILVAGWWRWGAFSDWLPLDYRPN